jgi:DNA repair photolyase
MIRPYSGNYMRAPIGLHAHLERCSNTCFYCFANLGNLRGIPVQEVYKDVQNLRSGDEGKSLTKFLFRRGHPICFSNTTDPFAASNADRFRELALWMTERHIPFALQTKGGKHFYEVVSKIRPTFIYFTITGDNNVFLKAREPGAPPYEARMDMVRHAIKCGHFVMVALNPFLSYWWNDIRKVSQELKNIGVTHTMMANLHITPMQRMAIPVAHKDKFEKEIADGMKRDNPHMAAMRAVMTYQQGLGFNPMTNMVSMNGHYWDDYFKLGYPFYPTIEAFCDHLDAKAGGRDKPIRFSLGYFHQWADIFEGFESSQFHDYLKEFRRSVFRAGLNENISSSAEVHELYWNTLDFITPLSSGDFQLSVVSYDPVNKKAVIDTDEYDIYMLRHDRAESDNDYTFVGDAPKLLEGDFTGR